MREPVGQQRGHENRANTGRRRPPRVIGITSGLAGRRAVAARASAVIRRAKWVISLRVRRLRWASASRAWPGRGFAGRNQGRTPAKSAPAPAYWVERGGGTGVWAGDAGDGGHPRFGRGRP